MAIHNGNTDFNLLVSNTGVRSFLIHWSKSSPGLTTTLEIFRPGDGQRVYNKTYSSSVSNGREEVQLPFYGEFYVKISTGNGYMWDGLKRAVRLSGTHRQTYTYTKSDVDRYRYEQIAVAFIFGALGLAASVKIAATVTAVSVGASVGTIWRYDTKHESIPAPRAGYHLRTIVEPVSGGVKYTYQTLSPGYEVLHSKTLTHNYLKYNF